MKLFKYNQFICGTDKINENLQQAKKFIKDNHILLTAAKELGFIKGELAKQLEHGERRTISMSDFTIEQQEEIKKKIREIRLPDDQVRRLESDPDFIKLRELLSNSLGWMYIFTYFFYVENVSFEEIKGMYDKLLDYRDLLTKLPKPLDNNFIDPTIPNNAEILADGIEDLGLHRKVKKLVSHLTPALKTEFNSAPVLIVNKMKQIAFAFDELGKKDDGTIDEEKRESLQKAFFGEVKTIDGKKRYIGQMRRYTDLRQFIKAAENYLKSASNSDAVEFYKKINSCNEKFGNYGADVVFDENGILIIEVKSFQANVHLNSHTRHCIKDWQSSWDSYVGGDTLYNKQYYIYNFNLASYEDLAVIGITIEPNQRIRAAHAKSDSNVASSVKSILKGWEKEYAIDTDLFGELKSMTTEEQASKRGRLEANRNIIKKGISIEEILKYVKEFGADVNKDNAKALENAVEDDDIEKVKLLLDLGASPNLKTRDNAIINKSKNLKMIKLLVDNGSEMTPMVFKNIVDDYEAVKYCLDAGIDPNFESSLPIRMLCRYTESESAKKEPNPETTKERLLTFKLLIERGADFTVRGMPLRWAAEYGRIEFIDFMIEKGMKEGFTDAAKWSQVSTRLTPEYKEKVKNYLTEKANEFEVKK
jgi:hypothetical protein